MLLGFFYKGSNDFGMPTMHAVKVPNSQHATLVSG
ncbi:hypothetical protein SHLO109777_14410 [Shewanella loihica]